MVFLVRLRIVADYGFRAHLAFRRSATIPVLVDHPQDGFPAAPYKDYPAQTVSLCGISLLVEHKCDGLAPAVLVSVRSAAVSHLAGYAPCLFVLAVIPVCGADGWIAPAAHLRKNLLILCGLGTGLHDAAVEQLRGRFRGRLFLPVLLPWFLRCPNGRIASRCHSVLLQISAPSAAEQRMQFDVSAAYLSGGRFALEYQEL